MSEMRYTNTKILIVTCYLLLVGIFLLVERDSITPCNCLS